MPKRQFLSPRRSTSAASWLIGLAAALGLVLTVSLSPQAFAEDAPADDPGFLEQIDAAFGKYLVLPLAQVMFFDLVTWDNTLPEGALPAAADGGVPMVGDEEVVEYREGVGYVYQKVETVKADELELLDGNGKVLARFEVVHLT